MISRVERLGHAVRCQRMLRLLTSPLVVLVIVIPLFLLALLRKVVQQGQQRGWLPAVWRNASSEAEVWVRPPPKNSMP